MYSTAGKCSRLGEKAKHKQTSSTAGKCSRLGEKLNTNRQQHRR